MARLVGPEARLLLGSPQTNCVKLRRWRAFALALTLCTVLPASSLAARPAKVTDQQRAQGLNEQARQAFKDGRFDEAADLFLQVYDLVRTPTAVFNAARAREAAKKWPEAKALFELYARIEKSQEGQADARKHLAEIDATVQAEVERKQREEAELRTKVEADAKRARDEAELAARKAQQERMELEQLKAREAERLKAQEQDKQREQERLKRQDPGRARLDPQPGRSAELMGVTCLPPTGATSEDSVRALQAVLQGVQAEAQAALVVPVRPVADYIQAEMARNLPGPCDFHCQLGVSRSLGSAFALTTALRYENGQMHLRQVLWRTADATDAAQVEVVAWTLPGLQQRAKAAAGDLWNSVRRYPVRPFPVQAGSAVINALQVESNPPGAQVFLDEADAGVTPVRVALQPGNHRIRVQKLRFHTRGGTLVLPAGAHWLQAQLPAQVTPEQNPGDPVAAPKSTEAQPAARPVEARAPGNSRDPLAPPAAVDSAPPAAAPPAAKALTSPPAPPGAAPIVAAEKSGLRWGVVVSAEGGAALIQDSTSKVLPDVSMGYGTFGHIGWTNVSDGPALVSLVGGVRWQKFQGISASSQVKAATPHGVSGWLGVLVPAANLLVSAHHNWMSVDNNYRDFAYNTVQARVIQGKGWLFLALGVEVMVNSDRPRADVDEFGIGPNLRLTCELGINLGGTPMSD